MGRLGWFISGLPELIQRIPWLKNYQAAASLQLPSEPDPELGLDVEPFEECLVLGFLRGKSVDDMVTELYEIEEEA